MEFLSNGDRYSISNALAMNNSPPAYPSASPFGFHSAGNPQLLDGPPQLHQKTKNSAENEENPEEPRSFMISSSGAQEVRRRHVSAPMSTAEATPATTTELRSPLSAGLGAPASLSVNGGGTAKVGKKRSRASRKVPTTLLNTDTSNFRAMVQRFTGIPEIPFGYSSMHPTLSPHFAHHEWELLGKPLPYKAVLDLNMNCVSILILLQTVIVLNNITAPQGQSSNATLLEDAGLINSASVFPNPAVTLSSDRRAAYLI